MCVEGRKLRSNEALGGFTKVMRENERDLRRN